MVQHGLLGQDVCLAVRAQRGAEVHLQQPWFEVLVDEDVKAVQLKAIVYLLYLWMKGRMKDLVMGFVLLALYISLFFSF